MNSIIRRKGVKQGSNADDDDIGNIMGSKTGDSEHSLVTGGWAGTDDATSTAPSDQMGNPPIPEEDKSVGAIQHDFEKAVEEDEEAQTDYK
jgi:hypothetical protein